MRATLRFTLALAAAVLPLAAHAQKRATNESDWDSWRAINGATLSNDGHWVAYTLLPVLGDGELVVRSTQGATEYRVPRGYLARANNTPGALRAAANANPEGEPAGPTATPAQFSADSKFALVLTQPSRAEVERAPRGGGAGSTRTSLAIVSLADGKVTSVAGVRSFRLARDNGTWVAYVPEPDSAAGNDAAGRAPAAGGGGRGGRGGRGGGGAGGGGRARYGSPLVLRNLASGAEERLADVLAFAFDDSAKTLAYTVVSRDSTKDGAYVRTLSNGATNAALTGRGDYRGVAFDRTGARVVFVSDRDEIARDKPRYTLYEVSAKGGNAQALVTPAAVPPGLHIAENAPLSFPRTGAAIMLQIAPPPIDSVPTDSLNGKAVFDLWHYKDRTLQPTQKLQAAADRNKTFTAAYLTTTKKLVQLTDDSITSAAISDDAKTGLATSRERYMVEQMWGDGGTDVYAVDPSTGARKLLKEKITGQAALSPDGKYITFFDRGHWYSYGIATAKLADISGGVKGVSFAQETDDRPEIPGPWGIAGWTPGDKSVLIYDRFDLWEFDPAGMKAPTVVTDSVGRRQLIQFRLAEGGGGRGGRGGGRGAAAGGAGGDAERGIIDPAEPLMLKATNTETMASGFYRDQIGVKKEPEKIVMADVAFGTPVKAANADEWMVTKSTFVDFPNIWVGSSLTNLTKVSDANPQQKDVNWGTVELVHWTSLDGKPLKGMLFKPENFDPSKKYPMITYFYELNSQTLHSYVPPNGRNSINYTHYVSNGYLVFVPDIVYETGYPGPSAVKCVVPGVEMLLARGYVDPKGLGIQGHSWGGYQTAFIITQSHLFSAAMAGAPVANMTSAYGGIRWGSGIARSGQYENGQSRIGKPVGEAPQLYIANSPLFWLDRVTTPLFILSDDADDAVPWYQGIELFVGMRRLGKEAYLIDYNNDLHSPASRANQKDIAKRMQQFFDAKLRGAPTPDWMAHGIPFTAKGKDQMVTAQP